jgi:hypothetical protein
MSKVMSTSAALTQVSSLQQALTVFRDPRHRANSIVMLSKHAALARCKVPPGCQWCREEEVEEARNVARRPVLTPFQSRSFSGSG